MERGGDRQRGLLGPCSPGQSILVVVPYAVFVKVFNGTDPQWSFNYGEGKYLYI